MSCDIRLKSSMSDLEKVRKILFPSSSDYNEMDISWNDTEAWTWKTDFDDGSEVQQTKSYDGNWLHNCLVASSPEAEVILIAHQDCYAVFTSKWEKNELGERQNMYHLTFISPKSNTSSPGENITAVVCIPIQSLQKSGQGMAEWICIALGFDSGSINFLTVDGRLLMVESFHDEPVQQLKYKSFVTNSTHQDLCIIYKKVVVLVEVIGLSNSLRTYRNHLAKGRMLLGEGDQHPPLHYKKFSLQEQDKINDCHYLGTRAPTQFDHLVTASMAGGFQARYNNAPPVASGMFSLGSQPYCSWHYAIEGSSAPLLTDVAYALASKVTSKFFSKTSGWLGWGGTLKNDGSSKVDKQVAEPATPVYPKYGLSDSLREALSVSVSPTQSLAAINDSLGRVILVDINRGIAIRVWKGYRDAQCAWVISWEEPDLSLPTAENPFTKAVTFLVIYIAKRGLIEIWTAQQGARVAAFNCAKGAKLLDMGADSMVDKESPQCYLICPDGKIYDVIVPFQCALKGDSSQRARDLHVLQKFRLQLQQSVKIIDNFELLLEIRHASVINQGFDFLLEGPNAINPDAFFKCLESIVKDYSQAEALDAESRLLLSRCRFLSRLSKVYIHLNNMQSHPPDYETVTEASHISNEEIASTLSVNVNEISRLFQSCCWRDQKQEEVIDIGGSVMEWHSIEMHSFLRSFEWSTQIVDDCVHIKTSLSSDHRRSLISFLWGTSLSRSITLVDELTSVFKNSQISSEDLVGSFMSYWLHMRTPATPSMLLHSRRILRFLCSLISPENVDCPEFPSPWWQNVADVLSKSSHMEQASAAALVCRSVIAEVEREKILQHLREETSVKENNKSLNDSMGEWEDMSVDMVQWNVLSKQFEDLSYLSRLIYYTPAELRQLGSQEVDYLVDAPLQKLEFTLATILQKGRGAVSELIAQWFTQNLLDVELIIQIEGEDKLSHDMISDMNDAPDQAPEADKMSLISAEEIEIIKNLFRDLRQHLPNSTKSDVLFLNIAVEYAAMWMKSPAHVKLLQRSIDAVLLVRSNLLRHGLCRTIWSMAFATVFHDLALLVDKTGRLPRNFSSRKINLPSLAQVIPFLKMSMKLLDIAITAAMSCEMEPPPMIRYDDLWSTCEGATPMLEIALRQRLINIDLVLLHHQLAQVLYLIACLEMKGVHAFSLFDQRVGRFAFFKDLHSYPPLPSSQDSDPTVVHNRLLFLKQVISKAVELMECDQSVALDFVNQAVKLSYEWGADVDELRIKYVELLFLNGIDHLAIEVLPSIGANRKLASSLLAAAGRRLKVLLNPSDVSALSPMTVSWLNGFQEDLPPAASKFDASKTLDLLVEALRRIPNDCNDQVIASELHSLLTVIQKAPLK